MTRIYNLLADRQQQIEALTIIDDLLSRLPAGELSTPGIAGRGALAKLERASYHNEKGEYQEAIVAANQGISLAQQSGDLMKTLQFSLARTYRYLAGRFWRKSIT
jgi:hypothetical protein